MPPAFATRRQRHAVTAGRHGAPAPPSASRAAALTAIAAVLLGGCGARRPPAPLGPVSESSAEVASTAPDAGATSALVEEPLPEESGAALAPTATDPASMGGTVLSPDPPSLLETLDGGTAPHVVAATRLVDAGRARMAAGQDGEALEQFERAIAVDPANFYAYYFLAELHLVHRSYDQAIAFADRAASLGTGADPAWVSRAYCLQGNAFEAVGRFADARRAYGQALGAAPANLAAQVGLTRVGGESPAAP